MDTYTQIYVCIHTCMHSTYIILHTCIHKNINIHIHTYMYTGINVHSTCGLRPPFVGSDATCLCSALALDIGATSRQVPTSQSTHTVSFVLVPVLLVHCPAEHIRCGLHIASLISAIAVDVGATSRHVLVSQLTHTVWL